MLEGYDVILASQSPRRQQLLREMDVNFRVEHIEGVNEEYPVNMPAEEVARYLAMRKADPFYVQENELLITADTIVVLDDQVLGKPADAAEARTMLRSLSGRTHRVITGVCVGILEEMCAFHDVTEVEFAPLTDDEIDYYIEHYHPMDKAGAYGIQDWIGLIGIKRINGCFYNVMGLPVPRLYALLKTL